MGEHAITITRGDSYPIEFTVTDKITENPINLTGATAILTVDSRKEPDDNSTKIFDVPGVIDVNPLLGKMKFTPTVVDNGVIGKYFYDVQLNTADGSVRTIAKDTYNIVMDISK